MGDMKRPDQAPGKADVPPPPPKEGVDQVSRDQALIADEWAPAPPEATGADRA